MLSPVVACSRCPKAAAQCAGPCACTVDGKDLTLHQARGYCPLGTFGTAEKPEGWDAEPDAPPPGKSRGLGGDIARVLTALGIKKCGGCEEREAALDEVLPRKT